MTTSAAAITRPSPLYSPRRFNARARQRFAKNRLAELLRSLGRDASYPERILVARIISVEWELRRQDAKLDAGEELSGHAMRARLAAETRLRLDLVALGLRPAVPKAPSLADIAAEIVAKRGTASAA